MTPSAMLGSENRPATKRPSCSCLGAALFGRRAEHADQRVRQRGGIVGGISRSR